MKKTILALAASALMSGAVSSVANACTTAVYNNQEVAISMRTMDWFGHDDAKVVGDGAGIERRYAQDKNAVTATSQYAALKVESFLPKITSEAMNEAGLEGRLLYLGATYTSYPKPAAGKENVNVLSVLDWAVDNYETVPELVTAIKAINIIDSGLCGMPPANDMEHCAPVTPGHFQFADKQGNTAVIEFVAGELKIYQSEGSAFMSNDPEFSYHLVQDAEQIQPDATIRPADRRMRAKIVVEDMYKRNVIDLTAAKNSIKAAAATAFAGYDQVDNTVGDVFPTLWTMYTDRNNGEWVLDRYDTWGAEKYDFTMFDTNKAERQALGIHPSPMYQRK
ncbi:linear amide C-N hydrolase [Agarivorans sp. MS3-6]|uniref:linear amide C-N hydrolase n=1 Tax=Agarivorans sp. TSD2052 TaxID=2937286 RepID=UPI00200F7204|nr:linear amide C-N hydrolase [Agarivorans sp. TSD2052]UPW17055.1 linear amide C-N hydrolase [Agarivorans sp. TSD2052]